MTATRGSRFLTRISRCTASTRRAHAARFTATRCRCHGSAGNGFLYTTGWHCVKSPDLLAESIINSPKLWNRITLKNWQWNVAPPNKYSRLNTSPPHSMRINVQLWNVKCCQILFKVIDFPTIIEFSPIFDKIYIPI